MGRIILTSLCLWSFIVVVSPLTDTQVHKAMEHIRTTFKLSDRRQYAFVAVFTEAECKQLSGKKNLKILQNEKADRMTDALTNEQKIYEGSQMVLATYISNKNKKEHDIHAEYRLLFPPQGAIDSPVQQLLNKNSKAACAIFYSLKTPCVGVCANTGHADNIINKLPVFDKFNNNKAFVYEILYGGKKQKSKDDIWAGLTEINKKMEVYRCFPENCSKCFEKENNKLKNRENCLN